MLSLHSLLTHTNQGRAELRAATRFGYLLKFLKTEGKLIKNTAGGKKDFVPRQAKCYLRCKILTIEYTNGSQTMVQMPHAALSTYSMRHRNMLAELLF